jgi:hypothetical protein
MTALFPILFLGVAATFLFQGCERHDIRVYTVPKESAAPERTATPATEPARSERPRPQLTWRLPDGWKEIPASDVYAAQFQVASSEGTLTVNVTPLPNLAGKETMVVNMWRQQVGQPPLEADALKDALAPADIAGETGQLFEISGQRGGAPVRIVTAMLHRADSSWFFKLDGSEAGVAAQKPAFLEFLKSFRIGSPTPSSP